jgi:hypothetical protein
MVRRLGAEAGKIGSGMNTCAALGQRPTQREDLTSPFQHLGTNEGISHGPVIAPEVRRRMS